MNLTAQQMKQALEALNGTLSKPLRLIVGGGGAMILAHGFPLATSDIDGIPVGGMAPDELDVLVKKVAANLTLPNDWLNPYFVTFTHVLPSDYGTRLETVCEYSHLHVQALSKTDLLIMKCFAGRMKDRAHAKALLEHGADKKFVETHLEGLKDKGIPRADKALDFLDEVLDTL